MTERKLEDMSKEELIRELEKLQTADRRFAARPGEADRERLIHDLHVHQVELETQNRELREAQERLEQATSRYSDLYDFAPIGYCTLDPKGIILEINLTGAALLGAPRDALLGKPFASVAPLGDKRQFYAHMTRCAERKARVTSEVGFSVEIGRRRVVQLVSDPFSDESGGPAGHRTMLVDISDIKSLEDRLRLLSDAGEKLTSSLEYSALLETTAGIVVPALADLCMLDVVVETGAVQRRVVQFADAKRQRISAERIRGSTPPPGRLSPQARVIASGEPMLLARGLAEPRDRVSYGDRDADPLLEVNLRSLMVVPLRARGETFGALTLAIIESDRQYSYLDFEVAQDLAKRVAMALDNGRLYAESRRATEDLRLAEAKSSGIVSISADAIISIDENQRITLFNEGAERIFGYSKAEAIGAPLGQLIPDRLRETHREHVDRFARGEEVARRMGERGANIVGLRKNGEEFPADAAISKLDVGGRKILTVALRDVTEQKRIEAEQTFLANVGSVLATTIQFEDALAAVADLALRGLSDFCIIDVVEENGEIRRLEVAGRDPIKQWVCDVLTRVELDRSHPYLLWSALEKQQALLVDTGVPEFFASWAQSDEYLRALQALDARSVLAVPLLARGRLVGAVALVSSTRVYGPADLHLAKEFAYRAALTIDNARLYRLAERAVRARDEMLGVVAHDLRNPLASILLQAALLRRRGVEPERRSSRPAEAIERAASRMNRLIEDLLDVARMEAGRMSIERTHVSVGALVSELAEAQRPLVSSKSLDLRVELDPNVGEVFADRERLLQALENLVSNAVTFTRAGGRITMGARPSDGEVLFWVSDTGAGIDAEALPHVFDRFWQARKTGRRGAGLGLPIVKGIVEAHGGRVWVESEVGVGSTFFFTVPVAPVKTDVYGLAPDAPAENREEGVAVPAPPREAPPPHPRS